MFPLSLRVHSYILGDTSLVIYELDYMQNTVLSSENIFLILLSLKNFIEVTH